MSAVGRLARGVAGMLRPPGRTRSQFGEDIFVGKFFADTSDGTWLDIGAFHPKIASNTALLRRRGWSGINVDADEVKIRVFRWFRRSDVNVVAAVAGTSGQPVALEHHTRGSYGSMDKLTATAEGSGLTTRTVREILDDAAPERVDFVSIDVEGLEGEILSAYPFDRYAPRLFCVEVLDTTLAGVEASAVTALLAAQGYQIVGWFPPSVFFAREPLRLPGA